MKKISILTKLGLLFSITLIVAACAGTGGMTTTASPQKEQLLTQAGFKIRAVTAPKQQQQLSTLPENKVSAVKYHGKIYYVYPGSSHNQVYVGNREQFQTYKQMWQTERAKIAQPTQANSMENPQPVFVEETAGPNPIVIEEYEGFGPLLPDTGE